MNRKIKFRAKPINLSFKYDDGEEGKVEWVYGYYSQKTTYSEPVSLGECTVEHFINVNCIPQSSEFEWYVTDFCKMCGIEDDYHNAFDNDNVLVYSDTKGEFIGLTDDNGVEIYEGDIIHIAGRGFKEYDFGVVTWHKNGYFFVDDSFGKYEKTNVNPIGDFFDRTKHDFNGIVITVNGNIHDNTELFKKEV